MDITHQAQQLYNFFRQKGYSCRSIAANCPGISKSTVGRIAAGDEVGEQAMERFLNWADKEARALQQARYNLSTSSSRPARYGSPPPSSHKTAVLSTIIMPPNVANMEVYNPDTNGREVVPYQQTEPRRMDNHAHVYNGPSAYLRDPHEYRRQIKQQRSEQYRIARLPKQPDPPREPFWSQVTMTLSRTFALMAEESS